MPSLFQVNEELKIQPKDLFAIPPPPPGNMPCIRGRRLDGMKDKSLGIINVSTCTKHSHIISKVNKNPRKTRLLGSITTEKWQSFHLFNTLFATDGMPQSRFAEPKARLERTRERGSVSRVASGEIRRADKIIFSGSISL
jgi:hypothetical protein